MSESKSKTKQATRPEPKFDYQQMVLQKGGGALFVIGRALQRQGEKLVWMYLLQYPSRPEHCYAIDGAAWVAEQQLETLEEHHRRIDADVAGMQSSQSTAVSSKQ